MRRLVMTDAHGSFIPMMQCLERSGFDNDKDQLFYLGDICDGFPDIKECIELLISIKNLICLRGNHDEWAIRYFTGDLEVQSPEFLSWQYHGGVATRKSYNMKPIPKDHLDFLLSTKMYHITDDNILFVHAGYDISKPIENQKSEDLLWNRIFPYQQYHLYSNNKNCIIDKYKEVYIGHTPTTRMNNDTKPLQMGNVIMMDTGATFTGCLSIMDIDTKEVWQSDKSMVVYPDHRGRNDNTWNEKRKELGI